MVFDVWGFGDWWEVVRSGVEMGGFGVEGGGYGGCM